MEILLFFLYICRHVAFVEDKIKIPPKVQEHSTAACQIQSLHVQEDKRATQSYLPRLPISSSSTSSSFNWYDGLIKRKELIEVEKELLRKREEFSANMAKIVKRKLDFRQAWKKVEIKWGKIIMCNEKSVKGSR